MQPCHAIGNLSCNRQSGFYPGCSSMTDRRCCTIRFPTFGLDRFQLIFRRWPNQISDMIFLLVPVVLILCANTVGCVPNKCTTEQTCVEINRCGELCAKIEQIGSVSRLPEDEKANFRKSICGFLKDNPMVCCKAASDSPVCGINTSSGSNPWEKVSPTCGRIKVKAN